MTKQRRIVEQLTKEEVKELKHLTSAHGHLNVVAEKCELHPNVLRIIIRNGYGLDFNIEKIRKAVLTTNLQLLAENQNTAA
jgi:hypothetical protein